MAMWLDCLQQLLGLPSVSTTSPYTHSQRTMTPGSTWVRLLSQLLNAKLLFLHLLPPAPLHESWDSDNELPREIPLLTSEPYEGFSSRPERDYLMDKAEDFLLADDPAIFSDEFSGGEDWQDMY